MSVVGGVTVPEPEPIERRVVYKDGSIGKVTVPPEDPPRTYIQLELDNHWYRWNQKLGAYKWYSYRTPRAVRREKAYAERWFMAIGGIASLLFFGWLAWPVISDFFS